ENMESRKRRYEESDEEVRQQIDGQLAKMNALRPEHITADWLCKAKNPEVPIASDESEKDKIPEIMRLLPMTLIDWLVSIRTPCDIILNLRTLCAEDVLELLYSCEGMITHLEMFNLKSFEDGQMDDIEAISQLQFAINEGSAIALKRQIRNFIQKETAGCDNPANQSERCLLFRDILRNIPKLQGYYKRKPLGTRIGSDSTSRSSKVHGMGFAYLDTLPSSAQKDLEALGSQRRPVPFFQQTYRQITYYPRRILPLGFTITRALRKLPGLRNFGKAKVETWAVNEKTMIYSEEARSITTLGGFQFDKHFDFPLSEEKKDKHEALDLKYVNTTIKNVLKVVVGFLLTFFTFQYTQDWWFLAWFGAFIWFGITGVRNVLQATLGGGGLRRTPLLGWNDYLSWSRLCDSLLFTGISVPLLELGVRTLLLGEGFGIDSLSEPVIFYTVMSCVNGLYIAGHNLFRGLPHEAVIGNLFRSILAIPVSVFYNSIAFEVFVVLSMPLEILIQSAAVLSKLASDTVAAIIEGPADKAEYLRRRHWDYVNKFAQLFDSITRLELLLPEEDVMALLRRPKEFVHKAGGSEAKELEKTIIVNALDLMYFWMYLPRARSTLARLIVNMTPEEKDIFVNAQTVLTRVHEISQLLVDGLVGMQFAKALAFYLDRHEEYLRDMSKLTGVELLSEGEYLMARVGRMAA
ncbi:hypothetical protein LJC46_08050, partial [Desulfovibrio sp. OttesenSCG-928-G15]|nr:hypothetical protein [Desulfovibrio sp. OttesenSCG-928-G15]